MGELSQAPKPAEHGSFLHTASVEGRKVDFIQTSDTTTANITLNAAGDASLFDFGYFAIGFNYTVNGNVKSWNDIIGWNYCAFFIDNVASDVVLSHQYRIGSIVSSARGTENINIFGLPNPFLAAGISHQTLYLCQNLDSSSHTIKARTTWKYIVTG